MSERLTKIQIAALHEMTDGCCDCDPCCCSEDAGPLDLGAFCWGGVAVRLLDELELITNERDEAQAKLYEAKAGHMP